MPHTVYCIAETSRFEILFAPLYALCTNPAILADSMLENELSEMNRDELKRFYECMEQFRNVAVQSPAYKAAEGKLGDFLAGLNLPEDMSQIIRCLKSEPEASRTKLGRSVVCLQAFTSWTTV